MENQGYEIYKNMIYHYNKSTILPKNNGNNSSGKQTFALNICYIFLTYQIEKGNLSIEYLPSLEMIGDFMSKPLQGKLFQTFP